jgi:hypothetical protein
MTSHHPLKASVPCHDWARRLNLLAVLIATAALLLPTLLAAATVELSARLTPRTFSSDSPATLEISIGGQQSAHITLPDVDGLTFHYRGQSRQFQMINGAVSSSLTTTYLVEGKRPGTYTIPPITVHVEGVDHQTEPLICTVTQAAAPSSGSGRAERDSAADEPQLAFIRLQPTKQRAYLNEVVPATIKAYFRQGIKVNLNALPTLHADGVLLDIADDEPLQQHELVKGTPYTVVTWAGVLTGIRAGRQDLTVAANTTLLVPSRRQQRRPGFGGSLFDDSLFDDLFGGYVNRPLTITAPTVAFTVDPLPAENRPEGFAGAIGSFTLNLKASPDSVEIGDPITLTMTVAGTGNFDTVTVPRLSSTEGLKSYTPTATLHQGKKIFEQAVVVTDPTVSHLPPLSFSFFDPQRRSYQTLTTDPLELTVTSPAAMPSPAVGQTLQQSRQRPASDRPGSPLDELAPVKLAQTAPASFVPLFLSPGFMIALTTALLAIVGVSVLRLHLFLQNRRPELLRSRAIERRRQETLKLIDQAGAGASADYLEAVRQTVRSFLALCWQTGAGALTTADINARLGNDSPIYTLFLLADRQAYGALALEESQRRELHDAIRTFIANCP